MSDDKGVVQVNLAKKVVAAKLPIEFDKSGWFVEFHGSYMRLRRARSQEILSVDYETIIFRAIQANVEAERRAKRAGRTR